MHHDMHGSGQGWSGLVTKRCKFWLIEAVKWTGDSVQPRPIEWVGSVVRRHDARSFEREAEGDAARQDAMEFLRTI